MMLCMVFHFFTVWVSLTQSAVTPLRTGDVAKHLTTEDIAALEMVLPSGAKPWLLNGDRGQVPRAEFIEAFLPPTTTTPELHRGPAVWVMRHTDPLTDWTVDRTELYAQVAIVGRKFDEIQSDEDINRPFQVYGHFDDTELVGLVHFLRSNPPTPGGRSNAIRPWPVLSVNRKEDDDSVEVMLRGGAAGGQAISLRRSGLNWRIVLVGMWSA
jgi:hypothetical protein